jgi:hypothetical protein
MDTPWLAGWTRRAKCILAVLLWSLPSLAHAADPGPYRDTWQYDRVYLKTGKALQGLVEEETPTFIDLACVRREVGQPTAVIHTKIPSNEVASIDRLGPRERELLKTRLQALDRSRERERIKHLELKSVPWRTGGKGLCYAGERFVLLSDARESFVRQAAVRLEQIYTAYASFLPPSQPTCRPTTILLVHSLAEFHELLQRQGRNVLNPAFYDAERNEILCASDLERLDQELEHRRQEHRQLRERLREQEAEWNKRYHGRIPPELIEKLAASHRKLREADEENQKIIDKATSRLYQTLYHEAFHAYLANCVYPPSETEVPRWLNEGLAQIFETAILDGDELRVGHVDGQRLIQVQALLHDGKLPSLTEILCSTPRDFVMAHADDQQLSNRTYLASWALAFYLAFDRKKLGTPELDQYVRRGSQYPLEAFRVLVGKPLPEFERDFRRYLQGLHASR